MKMAPRQPQRSVFCDAACPWTGARNKEDVEQHAHIKHGGPKPAGYQCEKCGRVLKRTSQRSKHRCTAVDATPKQAHLCRFGCGHSAIRKDNVRRHERDTCPNRGQVQGVVSLTISSRVSVTNDLQQEPVAAAIPAVAPPQQPMPLFDAEVLGVQFNPVAAVPPNELADWVPAAFDFNTAEQVELFMPEQDQSQVYMDFDQFIDPSLYDSSEPSPSSLGSQTSQFEPMAHEEDMSGLLTGMEQGNEPWGAEGQFEWSLDGTV